MKRVGFACLLALACGCLPSDSRPTPGSIAMTVVSSDAALHGFTTSDGWTIQFGRVLTAIGSMSLENYPDHSTSCNDYADPGYDRLFDFTKLTAPAKVGLAFGLGTCSVQYRFRSPDTDDLVETGATSADLTMLRTESMDTAYMQMGRIAFYVSGRATKASVTKTFTWTFLRGGSIDHCQSATSTTSDSLVELKANDMLTIQAVVRPEELFRQLADDSAPFVFDSYAAADANGDGDVSLDELTTVPPPTGAMIPGQGGAGGMAPTIPPKTLGDYVYDTLLSRVSRVDGGGPCETNGRGGGG